MNIVNKVTARHMKLNKKRTMVTICGIIISVAMITAVFSISGSFLDMFQRTVISQTGEWHVQYEGVPAEKTNVLQRDGNTKGMAVSKEVGYAPLEGSKNSQRPYLYVTAYDDRGLSSLPVTLLEGRMPRQADEIVLSDAIYKTAGVKYQVGDTLSMTVGNRISYLDGEPVTLDQSMPFHSEGETPEQFVTVDTRKYQVVGIANMENMDGNWYPGYPVLGWLDVGALSPSEPVNVFVGLNKVTKQLYSQAQRLAEEADAQKVTYNSQLLIYYGVTSDTAFQNTMLTLTGILAVIILVGSISLIYNAFAISLSERSRYLGMLSSVGATKRQKRGSVFYEGAVVGAVAIPLGILFGSIGIGVTFYCVNPLLSGLLNNTVPLRLVVSPAALVGILAFSIVMITLSAWFPARRASHITPIDAIRQTQDFKLKGKNVKTSRLTKRIFGFEAELGMKNLKRNRHRYYATLFSLVISIVLFLTASCFTMYLHDSYDVTQMGLNFDVAVAVRGENEALCKEYVEKLESLQAKQEAVSYQSYYLPAVLKKEQIGGAVRERLDLDVQENPIEFHVVALDKKSLSAYAKEVGIEAERLFDVSAFRGILVNQFVLKEAHTYTEIEALNVVAGEKIPFQLYTGENQPYQGQIEVAAVTGVKAPSMGNSEQTVSALTLVTSQQALSALLQDYSAAYTEPITFSFSVQFKTEDASALEAEIETLKTGYPELSGYTTNVARMVEQGNKMTLLMSVFLYGFVALIAAISIANIFNTISTSVSLRRREFAMLKSVGMTPPAFRKIIRYESLFYGLKSLLYGLPLSFMMMYLMAKAMAGTFALAFSVPWESVAAAIAAVFLTVGSTMAYALRKIKDDNIVDMLKEENI